jgi:lipopolysaccharide biosynthesis glycosyltransferase
VPDRINVDNYGKFSVASIFRLLIPQAFKSFNQVVYLDSDLVFNGLDIATLILSGAKSDKPLAGVVDPYIAIPKSQQLELSKLGLDPAAYINSGVLIIRPSSMPENLLEEFEKFQKIGV